MLKEDETKVTCTCLFISTVQVYSYEQGEENKAVYNRSLDS